MEGKQILIADRLGLGAIPAVLVQGATSIIIIPGLPA